jgi:minor extracellular serine protease Vpr
MSKFPAAIAAAVFSASMMTHAQSPQIDVSQLKIPAGNVIDVAPPTGEIEVWVSLVDPSLGEANGRNAKRSGSLLTRAQQNEHSRALTSKQDVLSEQVQRLGGREIARVRKAHNAVAVRIDASQLGAISALPGVVAVRPVRNYRVDLSSTVPYIGAAAVQAAGFDGTGVTVAVLDTGIDYTHRNLGGSGLVTDYVSAYGANRGDARNKTRDGLFPTAKVVGGFDFVGEDWPDKPLAPDEDPIDFGGHGTPVADIIAGRSLDNAHRGVAPGASLLAIKVCSAVSTACSGVALLQGMDFALDPNGDDDLSDAADVINMSLGSNYGQKEDDLSEASNVAVDFGVVVVAAAGNAGDRPYIVSSPSSAPNVISVAQTQVPTATVIPLVINSPAGIAGTYRNTATLDFAPVSSATTGDVAFVGRGCPAGSISPTSPEDPYLVNPAGKIALIDRGVCSVSLKIDRAARAGATGVLIGLVAAGDAIPFAFGGGTTFVPSLVITQSTANLIKANIAAPVNVTISPAFAITLATSVVGTSARGPSYSYNAIKPDIAAPGASVSAVVGSGTGESAFGGTSGATPMISGSAALLVQAHPRYEPVKIKSTLMNTAETNVLTNPATLPGVLAPVTRIGGGEVRVDKALASTTAAWDSDTETGSLSFGYEGVTRPTRLARRVTVANLGDRSRTYAITTSFRYPNDAASGAVAISAPSSVHVPARGTRSFDVVARIDPAKLPVWNLNGGNLGGNGSLLQNLEFDGYIGIADQRDNVHVAWHVLPHKAAAVRPASDKVELENGTGSLQLTNGGAVDGRVEVFSLTGTSKKIPRRDLPQPGDNFAIIDLEAVGVRLGSAFGLPTIQFGITTRGQRSHPNYPAEFDVYIDNNRDGTFDYAIFNSENGGFGATGQNVVSVINLTTGVIVTNFFADADLDSANFIATALLSDLGLTPNAMFDFSVNVFDNYFTGQLTDAIEGMTYTPAQPRFTASGLPATGVPVGGTISLSVQETPGGDTASPSQTGLLLLYRDGAPKSESDSIKVTNERGRRHSSER